LLEGARQQRAEALNEDADEAIATATNEEVPEEPKHDWKAYGRIGGECGRRGGRPRKPQGVMMRMHEGVLDKGAAPVTVRKRAESLGPQEKLRLRKYAANAKKKIESEVCLRRYLVETTVWPLKQVTEALNSEEKWQGLRPEQGLEASSRGHRQQSRWWWP